MVYNNLSRYLKEKYGTKIFLSGDFFDEDVMKAIEKMRENTMQQNGKEKSSCGFLV